MNELGDNIHNEMNWVTIFIRNSLGDPSSKYKKNTSNSSISTTIGGIIYANYKDIIIRTI